MIQVTRYTILKTLVKKDVVNFDSIRRLMMLVIPETTRVSPNHSVQELENEYRLVEREIRNLCKQGIETVDTAIKVGTVECKKKLTSIIEEIEEQKEKTPKLVKMYLDAVGTVLP